MKRTSSPPSERHLMYCRELGHVVPFAYCRSGARGVPCRYITSCWYDIFLIEVYLREELSSSQWDEFLAQGHKSRLTMLLEAMGLEGRGKSSST